MSAVNLAGKVACRAAGGGRELVAPAERAPALALVLPSRGGPGPAGLMSERRMP